MASCMEQYLFCDSSCAPRLRLFYITLPSFNVCVRVNCSHNVHSAETSVKQCDKGYCCCRKHYRGFYPHRLLQALKALCQRGMRSSLRIISTVGSLSSSQRSILYFSVISIVHFLKVAVPATNPGKVRVDSSSQLSHETAGVATSAGAAMVISLIDWGTHRQAKCRAWSTAKAVVGRNNIKSLNADVRCSGHFASTLVLLPLGNQ